MHVFHFSIIYAIWFFVFFLYDLFSVSRVIKFFDFFKNYILAVGTAVILAIIYFYIQTSFDIIAPKTFLLITTGIFFILSVLWHRFFLAGFLGRGLKERVVIIGINKISDAIFQEIKKHNRFGYKVLSFVDIHSNGDGKKIDSIDVIGLKDFKESVLRGLKIDLVIVAVDLANERNVLDELFSVLSLRSIEFTNAFSFYEKLTGKVLLGPVGKLWFLENLHHATWYNISKRIFDLIFSFFAGFVFLAILPPVALAVKWDSRGPVFYKQKTDGASR